MLALDFVAELQNGSRMNIGLPKRVGQTVLQVVGRAPCRGRGDVLVRVDREVRRLGDQLERRVIRVGATGSPSACRASNGRGRAVARPKWCVVVPASHVPLPEPVLLAPALPVSPPAALWPPALPVLPLPALPLPDPAAPFPTPLTLPVLEPASR